MIWDFVGFLKSHDRSFCGEFSHIIIGGYANRDISISNDSPNLLLVIKTEGFKKSLLHHQSSVDPDYFWNTFLGVLEMVSFDGEDGMIAIIRDVVVRAKLGWNVDRNTGLLERINQIVFILFPIGTLKSHHVYNQLRTSRAY